MNWCVIAFGGLIGVAAGCVRLAYLIGRSNGEIAGEIAGIAYASEKLEESRIKMQAMQALEES